MHLISLGFLSLSFPPSSSASLFLSFSLSLPRVTLSAIGAPECGDRRRKFAPRYFGSTRLVPCAGRRIGGICQYSSTRRAALPASCIRSDVGFSFPHLPVVHLRNTRSRVCRFIVVVVREVANRREKSSFSSKRGKKTQSSLTTRFRRIRGEERQLAT